MPKFEDYQQKKKQNEDMNVFYASREAETLGTKKELYVNFPEKNDFEYTLDRRLQNTTFAERTEYYFENTELMKQKVVRYYRLSGDSSDPEDNRAAEVEAHSRQYTNHWARKRKSAAMNAAIKFDKAVRLQEQLKHAENLTPYQTFEKREKIMRLRLDGMLEAAKVKSESAAHEEYLKSKAKVSCLTIISDQLDNLWKEEEKNVDVNQRKKFMKKQKAIEKELLQAKQSFRASAGNFEEKWLSKNRREFDDLDFSNPVLSEEKNRTVMPRPALSKQGKDLQKELNLLNRDGGINEFPRRITLKDRNANLLTGRDTEAKEWNDKYNLAQNENDLETQKAMMMEEIRVMMDYPLPSIKEIKQKGTVYFLKKDFQGLYRMINTTAPGIVKLAEVKNQGLPENEKVEAGMSKYLGEKPDIMTKAAAFIAFGELLDEELKAYYKLGKAEDGSYIFRPGAVHDNAWIMELMTNYENQLNLLDEQEVTVFEQENRNQLSVEEERVQLLKINGNMTEEMRELYHKINVTVVPRSTAAKLAKQALKDLPGLFGNFEFPNRNQFNNDWLENKLNENPRELLNVLGKARALMDTAQDNAELMNYQNEHPEFTAKLNAAAQLADHCRDTLRYLYSIDVGTYLDKCEMISPLSDEERVALGETLTQSGYKYGQWVKNVAEWKKDDDALKADKTADDQLEEESKNIVNHRFNYNYFKAAKESNRVVFHPVFRARIRNAQTKRATGEYKAFKTDQHFNIYETAGTMLKSVKYNDDFTPATYEDQQKHEWNDRWTKAIEDGDMNTISSMSMEGLPEVLSMQLPNPDELRMWDWVGKQLEKNSMRFFETMRRVSGLFSLANQVPQLKKFMLEHPALIKKTELMLILRDYANDYMNGVHKAGFDFRVSEKNRGQKNTAWVSTMNAVKVDPMMHAQGVAYEVNYWKYADKFSNEYYAIRKADKKTQAYWRQQQQLQKEKQDAFLQGVEKDKKSNLPDFDESMIEKVDEEFSSDEFDKDIEGIKNVNTDFVPDSFLDDVIEEKKPAPKFLFKSREEAEEDGEIEEDEEQNKEEFVEEKKEVKRPGTKFLFKTKEEEEAEEKEKEKKGKEKKGKEKYQRRIGEHEDLRTVAEVREEEERKAKELKKIQEEKEDEKEEDKKEDKKEDFDLDNVIMVREDLRTRREIQEEEARKAGKIMDDMVKQYPFRELKYTKAYIKDAGTIKKKYEKQEYASNDCWSCAGPAILNHLLHKEKGYKYVTQKDFRGFEPKFLKAEDMGLDEGDVETQKVDIMTFTTLNNDEDRKGSPIGNPYLIADFYFKELAKYPAHKNTAVRKMLFQVKKAVDHQRGIIYTKNEKGNIIGRKRIGKNRAAVHNLQQQFRDTVTAAINKDAAVAMYYHGHYYVITGINGDTLEVCDSLKKYASKTLNIQDVIGQNENSDPLLRPVELVWLDKIQDPDGLAKEFKGLKYDEKTGAFSTDQEKFSDNVAHVMGVDVAKEPDEHPEDVSSYIEERIYVPKTFDKTVNIIQEKK
jgi:hypothetical protein